MAEPTRQIPFTCTLDCGSRCELVAWVRDDQVIRMETPGNRADTTERPRLIPCARGRAQHQLQHASERILTPLKRTGARGSGEFRAISWGEALDLVAERLSQIRDQLGAQAILHASGAGSVSGRGFSGAGASRRFFTHFGPVSTLVGNESNHCSDIAARWMLGGRIPGSDRATLLQARLIILWGNNPAETRMGPNTGHFVASARDRGAKTVLIDPRCTDTAVLADTWIPIRPGTDAALAAALGFVLIHRDLVDRAFLSTHTTGYEQYHDYLVGLQDGTAKTPRWAESITGIPSDTIEELALDLGSLKPAALLPGWGPQRSRYGEQIARAWITLACMTGNVGLSGGGLASIGTRSGGFSLDRLPEGPHRPSRTLSATEWAPPILAEEVEPPIEMVYIVAANLINRSPNTVLNAHALNKIPFTVVNEQYMTPTARYADIVLPIQTDLERAELVTSWGHDAHLFFNTPAVPPVREARTDYWVFAQLARRLGFEQAYTLQRTEQEWIAEILELSGLSGDWQKEGLLRTDGNPRVALSAFRKDPDRHPLNTPSGRIEIVCTQAENYGLPAIPSYVPVANASPSFPLQLITPHSKLRSNSCSHANKWLQEAEPHRLWIHPIDAQERGVTDGDWVKATSPHGATLIPAYVTERIMPGVVCIYHGTWYQPGEDGIDLAGCANVLTSHQHSPTGGLATHTAWVQVEQG